MFSLLILSLINPKVRKRVKGNGHWKTLPSDMFNESGSIWIHCASLGEFEQARTIIDAIVSNSNPPKILLTFFSPSGFEAIKEYKGVTAITYLPLDRISDVREFLHWARPIKAIFIKYEIWFNYLYALSSRSIPASLVSAHFQEQHWMLRFPLFGQRLVLFDKIFVQNVETQKRLSKLNLSNTVLTGDTRYDRVVQVSKEQLNMPNLENWAGKEALVVGSNWPSDDAHLIDVIFKMKDLKVVVAPHEINESQYSRWQSSFKSELIKFSQLSDTTEIHARIIFIDQIGLLSKLYRLGAVAYVGGGFGSSVHNTLEASVYGIPVMFGPNNSRFYEIKQLKRIGAGLEVNDANEIEKNITRAINDTAWRLDLKAKLTLLFGENEGATNTVLNWIDSSQDN